MSRSATALTSVLAISLCAVASAPSHAATLSFTPSATGVSHCQAALPAYEGQIRKRPLAIQNEGTADAFITCSLPAEGTAFNGTEEVFLFLVSTATTDQTVTCTLVSGLTNSPIQYFTKVVTVPVLPPGNGTRIDWLPADNAGANFSRWVQVSCSIPPGIGIGHLGKMHDLEIGS